MELNSYKCNEIQCLKNCDKVLFDENICIFIHSECEPLKLYVNKDFKWPHILHPGSFTHILYFLKSMMSVFLKQVKIYVIYVVYYYWYVWRPDLNIAALNAVADLWNQSLKGFSFVHFTASYSHSYVDVICSDFTCLSIKYLLNIW